MARPSLKAERQTQIIEAFERCVIRYGMAGATLERLSEEAGLARPLIRHNIGNREALVEAFMERFFERSDALTEDMITALPAKEPSRTLIEWLFAPEYSDSQNVLLATALIFASQSDKKLAERLRKWNEDFIVAILKVLEKEFPNTPANLGRSVATGITGLYFNYESTAPLGDMMELREASKEAALLLLSKLV